MLTQDEQQKLEHYLSQVLAVPVHLLQIHRFYGGASRETYGLDVDAGGQARGLVLRRDPGDSLIETVRGVEFAAFQSMEKVDIPTPRAVCLEESDDILGAPFLVMERIDGGVAVSPFDTLAYGANRASIGAQFFDFLGRIAAAPALDSPMAKAVTVPSPDACWQRELDYWGGIIARDRLEPEPIAQAALRWLRRNPPPPAQRLSIVHGDYRNGNVLHDDAGSIVAVLDWEMAHIGDPYEDLGWALDPLWTMGKPDLAAGLIPRSEAIARWEATSGCRFDPDAFLWWEVFAMVKGLAIWISSAKVYAEARNTDPVLAFSGWYTRIRANRSLAERLAGLAGVALEDAA